MHSLSVDHLPSKTALTVEGTSMLNFYVNVMLVFVVVVDVRVFFSGRLEQIKLIVIVHFMIPR